MTFKKPSRWTLEPHPDYGPCDTIGPNGDCTECIRLRALKPQPVSRYVGGRLKINMPFEEAVAFALKQPPPPKKRKPR